MAAKDHLTPDHITRWPQHAKLDRLEGQNETVQEFIDWLFDERKATICEWRDAGNNGQPRHLYRNDRPRDEDMARFGGDWERCRHDLAGTWRRDNPEYDSWPAGYIPLGLSRERLMAEFFGIDLAALDREKRDMLEMIRAANKAS